MSEQPNTLRSRNASLFQIRRGLVLAEYFGEPVGRDYTVEDLTIRPDDVDYGSGLTQVVGSAANGSYQYDWVVSSHGGVILSAYSAEGRTLMWIQALADGSWCLHMRAGVWGTPGSKVIHEILIDAVAGLPGEED